MPSQAHLLNMTRITLNEGLDQNISMTVVIDLTRAIGSGENYYLLSQQPDLLTHKPLLNIAQRIQQASEVTINEQPLNWQLTSVNLPHDTPKSDFVSGFAWPMSTFVFTAIVPANERNKDAATLQATFTPEFQFEEPIALSIQQVKSKRSLNRWLVRNQQSPAFNLTAQLTTSPENITESMWLEYLWQGIIHILPKGWDHALFVLGLFLGARKVRDLILWITGFTMAHTVTLGLASYGAIAISPAIIEPVIALSIAWIAVENIWQRPTTTNRASAWWRLAVVILFGLVHGLGFAVVLKELGFPAQGFMTALISFNIGVELAQLAIIAAAFVLLGHWYQHKHWRTRIVIPGSAIIACIALLLMALRLI